MIEFAHSQRFWLLLIGLPLGGLIWRTRRRNHSAWKSLGQRGPTPADGSLLIVIALALGVIGLAEPRWGRVPGGELPTGRDVVFVVDVSRSMAAEDAVPNRLDVGVKTGQSVVRSLKLGDRAALVAFAGSARLRCPLTEKLGAVDYALEVLRPGEIKPGGSDLGAALEEGVRAFGGDDDIHGGGRSLVVISDGEDHAGSWPKQLIRLKDAGILVTSIAIGDPKQGASIPTENGPLLFKSETVITYRVDRALSEVAFATGGLFLPVGLAATDLSSLDQTTLAPAAERAITLKLPPEPESRYGPIVCLALGSLLVACLPGTWFRRNQLRKSIPVLAFAAMALGATLTDLMTEAQVAYRRGDLSRSLQILEQAKSLDPANPLILYNFGATLYRMERFGEAKDSYLAARSKAETSFRSKIDYALGNVSLRLGDPASAVDYYAKCLEDAHGEARFESMRQDARINKEFAESLLKQPQADTVADPPNPGSHPDSPKPSGKDPGPPQDPQPDSRQPSPPAGNGSKSQGKDSKSESKSSPDQRLSEAIQAVNRARSAFRFQEYPPPNPASDGRKDW